MGNNQVTIALVLNFLRPMTSTKKRLTTLHSIGMHLGKTPVSWLKSLHLTVHKTDDRL